MLFLLRSIFWLSIVFASVSWPSDPLGSVMAKVSAARRVQRQPGQDDRHGASRGEKGLFARACRLS
jgi:hypothetical protein